MPRQRLTTGRTDWKRRSTGSDGIEQCRVFASARSLRRLPNASTICRKRAREYLHHVDTFVDAEEVPEIFLLRDQNRALIKLVAEMEAGNRWPHCQNGDSVGA
jgi:hypothetical protein